MVCAIGAGRSRPQDQCPRHRTGTYERRTGCAKGVEEGRGCRTRRRTGVAVHRTVVVMGRKRRDWQRDLGEWEVEKCVLLDMGCTLEGSLWRVGRRRKWQGDSHRRCWTEGKASNRRCSCHVGLRLPNKDKEKKYPRKYNKNELQDIETLEREKWSLRMLTRECNNVLLSGLCFSALYWNYIACALAHLSLYSNTALI